MASFREQMQRLADNIARTRNERKAFLDKNQKECTRKRRELKDQRNQTRIELAQDAKALSKQLEEFKRNNQKTVEKTLRDLRTLRVKTARNAKSALKQEIVRNRREIVRMLRQSNSERMRAARQQDRASAITIKTVRSHVQRIKSETKRMTKAWARDRNDARQIWMRLQNSFGAVRESQFASRAVEAPVMASVSTAVKAATVVPPPVDFMSQRSSVLPVPPSLSVAGVS